MLREAEPRRSARYARSLAVVAAERTATGSVKTVSRRPRGDPPTLSSSVPWKTLGPPANAGTTTKTAVRLHATPPAAMTAPTRTRPRPSAYQMPSAAIVSPTSSPVPPREPRTPQTGAAGCRRGTRRRKSSNGSARLTGWNTSTTRPRRPRVREIREREKRSGTLRGEVSAPQPEDAAAHPSAIAESLHGHEGQGRWYDDPERREQRQNGIDV